MLSQLPHRPSAPCAARQSMKTRSKHVQATCLSCWPPGPQLHYVHSATPHSAPPRVGVTFRSTAGNMRRLASVLLLLFSRCSAASLFRPRAREDGTPTMSYTCMKSLFFLFRAAPVAYTIPRLGVGQSSLRHSHSNARSEPHMRPTPQQHQILNSLSKTRGQTTSSWILSGS